MTSKIIALHGFLGSPKDWKEILPVCTAPQLHAIDVFDSLDKWATRFLDENPFQGNKEWLVGYSLGGRAALHLLEKAPERWKGAVIISANLGLAAADEKLLRLMQDKLWTEKFLKAPWNEVLADWNSQPVFQGSLPLELQEGDRNQLTNTLTAFSLAKQPNFEKMVASLEIPILWIGGALDPSFEKQTERLHFLHPKSKIWIADGAGHRVIFDKTKEISKIIQQFITENAHE